MSLHNVIKGNILEHLKPWLKEDEVIWWEGHPDKYAVTEEYRDFRITAITLLIIASYFLIFSFSWMYIINGLAILFGIFFFAIPGVFGIYMFWEGYKYRHYVNVSFFITSKRIFMINKGRLRKSGSKVYFFKDVLLSTMYEGIEDGIVHNPHRSIARIEIKPSHRGYTVYFFFFTNEWGHWFKFEQISDTKTLVDTITNNMHFRKIPNKNKKVEIYKPWVSCWIK